ncbi:MAG: cytochrome c5 family protein [Alcanivoracaceae bacterium]|nr:cytochrome c5 family protein [Alcanivoracaceae bacterium]
MKNNVLIVLLIMVVASCNQPKKNSGTDKVVDTTTTGYMEEQERKVAIKSHSQRSGIEVYEGACIACHGKTTQGAPIPGDKDDWDVRKKQGMKQLLSHTINGFGDFMPVRGGCFDCNDKELQSAIEYMIELPEIRLDLNIRM